MHMQGFFIKKVLVAGEKIGYLKLKVCFVGEVLLIFILNLLHFVASCMP